MDRWYGPGTSLTDCNGKDAWPREHEVSLENLRIKRAREGVFKELWHASTVRQWQQILCKLTKALVSAVVSNGTTRLVLEDAKGVIRVVTPVGEVERELTPH